MEKGMNHFTLSVVSHYMKAVLEKKLKPGKNLKT